MVDAVRKDLFAGMALVLNEQEARAIALRFGLDDGPPLGAAAVLAATDADDHPGCVGSRAATDLFRD